MLRVIPCGYTARVVSRRPWILKLSLLEMAHACGFKGWIEQEGRTATANTTTTTTTAAAAATSSVVTSSASRKRFLTTDFSPDMLSHEYQSRPPFLLSPAFSPDIS